MQRNRALFGLILTLIVPSLGLARFADRIQGISGMLVREGFWYGLIAAVLVFVLIVERRTLKSVGLRRPDWSTLGFGLGFGLFGLIAGGMIVGAILSALGLQMDAAAMQKILSLPFWIRALVVIRAAFGEELYRAYTIERVTELTGSRMLAAAVSLASFMLAHVGFWGWAHVIVAGVAGLIVTALYLWRRDLTANAIAHFIPDAVGVLLRLAHP